MWQGTGKSESECGIFSGSGIFSECGIFSESGIFSECGIFSESGIRIRSGW